MLEAGELLSLWSNFHMERIAGLPYMEVQSYLGLFYAIRFWSGAAMLLG